MDTDVASIEVNIILTVAVVLADWFRFNHLLMSNYDEGGLQINQLQLNKISLNIHIGISGQLYSNLHIIF